MIPTSLPVAWLLPAFIDPFPEVKALCVPVDSSAGIVFAQPVTTFLLRPPWARVSLLIQDAVFGGFNFLSAKAALEMKFGGAAVDRVRDVVIDRKTALVKMAVERLDLPANTPSG